MSWLSITRREAEAEDCIITDRQLPDHPPLAWTDNVQYFEDEVDVRTFKIIQKALWGITSIYLTTEREALGCIVAFRSVSGLSGLRTSDVQNIMDECLFRQ